MPDPNPQKVMLPYATGISRGERLFWYPEEHICIPLCDISAWHVLTQGPLIMALGAP